MKVIFSTDEFYEGTDNEGMDYNGTFKELVDEGVNEDTITFSDELWNEQVDFFHNQMLEVIESHKFTHMVLFDKNVYEVNHKVLEIDTYDDVYVCYNENNEVNIMIGNIDTKIRFITEDEFQHIRNASPLEPLFSDLSGYGKQLKFNDDGYFIDETKENDKIEIVLSDIFEEVKENRVFNIGVDWIEIGEDYNKPIEDQDIEELAISEPLLKAYNNLIDYVFDNIFYDGKTLGKHIKGNNEDYISHFMFQQDDIGFYPLVVLDTEHGMKYLPFVN